MEQRNQDASKGVGRLGEPVRSNDHDIQVDKDTGLPEALAPDGEKQDTSTDVPEGDRLKIDPDSRIPLPVQPDLA